MKLSDFDFVLPEDLIALRPARPRSASRLLVADGPATSDSMMTELPEWLRPGDLLVFNNTAVIPARLNGTRTRETQDGDGRARIEVTLIRREAPEIWGALARPARRLKPGDVIHFDTAFSAEVRARNGGEVTLAFNRSGEALDRAIVDVGEMPLPPYIAQRRPADAADRSDYQTIFAERAGAVAAPTASLHFDDDLLARIDDMGVGRTTLTLHVGAGTFLPVTEEDPTAHRMHSEWGEILPEAAAAMNTARAAGGRLIAAGTTALRLIESAAAADGTVRPWKGETDIFITPGYGFRATDGLITNFHLPKSTLFMLVSALMGRERMQTLYAHAIRERYRFYSYGDASLLLPAN